MKINIELNDKPVRDAFNRLLRAGTDLSPMLGDIGDKVLTSTHDRFNTQEEPNGKPWAPLSTRTTLKRKPRNKDKILTQEGHLRGNLVYQVGHDYVEIGSPSIYANTHQFGAKQGAFGTTKRGAPIPWGDIPARPFLGISTEDEADIKHIILDHIARHWRCLR